VVCLAAPNGRAGRSERGALGTFLPAANGSPEADICRLLCAPEVASPMFQSVIPAPHERYRCDHRRRASSLPKRAPCPASAAARRRSWGTRRVGSSSARSARRGPRYRSRPASVGHRRCGCALQDARPARSLLSFSAKIALISHKPPRCHLMTRGRPEPVSCHITSDYDAPLAASLIMADAVEHSGSSAMIALRPTVYSHIPTHFPVRSFHLTSAVYLLCAQRRHVHR
jgi:hypothetical protein